MKMLGNLKAKLYDPSFGVFVVFVGVTWCGWGTTMF